MTSNPDIAAERRETILAAAQRAFDKHGYAATTMDEVAAEAGLSKGSVYNYFKSKELLFSGIHVAAVEGVVDDLRQIAGSTQRPREKLLASLDYWYDRASQWTAIGRLFLEFWATAARSEQNTINDVQQPMYDATRQLVAEMIAEGVGCGDFAADTRPEVATDLILALLDGIQLQAILGTGRPLDDDYMTSAKRAVLTALTGRDVEAQEVQNDG